MRFRGRETSTTLSTCTDLVRAVLPKADAKKDHPFFNIGADQENSMAVVEFTDRLNNPSAQWLTASLDVILSAYSNIHSLANSNSKWVNDGLDHIVKLLDLCNGVSDNIADVKRYEKLLQTTIHSLAHTGRDINNMSQSPLLIRATNLLADCRRAISNVNAKCNNNISRSRGMVSSKKVISACSNYSRVSRLEDDLLEDMGNLKDCTASVLKTVANALSLDLPRPSLDVQRDPRLTAGCCYHLRSLIERARNNNRSKRSRCLLHEFVFADILMKKLYDILAEKEQKKKTAEVKDLVEELEKCRVELDNGIAAIDIKIKELYSALIRARVALLDILTYSL